MIDEDRRLFYFRADFAIINPMSELVLYRKYRPRSFEEVVGQEHVVAVLTNALKQGRVAHAYLFSGPRGTGKTTIARLIAKALNCSKFDFRGKSNFDGETPCNRCEMCEKFNSGRGFDLIEIDAASNRGIDEVRQLREGVRTVPVEGKYKVYIIDEVHQLTREAFNALLKTLEEPPSHAVFILATTELEKVPSTVVSRTQHFDFRRPSVKQIAERLVKIAHKEGAKLDAEGAHLIALAAEGSLRDGESILGQIMAVEDKKITRAEIENILGLPRREAAKKMFELVVRADAPGALALIQELHDSGYDLTYFSKLLLQYFRNALFLKTDSTLKAYVAEEMLQDEFDCISANLGSFGVGELSRAVNVIFENLQHFKKTPIPQLPLELTVLEIIRKE